MRSTLLLLPEWSVNWPESRKAPLFLLQTRDAGAPSLETLLVGAAHGGDHNKALGFCITPNQHTARAHFRHTRVDEHEFSPPFNLKKGKFR